MAPRELKHLRLAAYAALAVLGATALPSLLQAEAKAKVHTVVFGAARKVPYSAAGDPAGNDGEETELKIRPLLVDGKAREWTTGDAHDVTDRSVAVRRALRLNDALPTEKTEHWIWQRGPWLLIDRSTGKVTALHLPEFDPSVSSVTWFRDFAAYCGLSSGGKQLYAVVAQVAGRKTAADEENRRLGSDRPSKPSLRAGRLAGRSAEGDLRPCERRTPGQL